MFLKTQCHTLKHLAGNNLLKMIIYSLSAPPPLQLSALQLAQNLPALRVRWAGRYIFLEQVSVPQTRSNCLAFAATVGVFECRVPPTPPAVDM